VSNKYNQETQKTNMRAEKRRRARTMHFTASRALNKEPIAHEWPTLVLLVKYSIAMGECANRQKKKGCLFTTALTNNVPPRF
jgi:hypothetical protein